MDFTQTQQRMEIAYPGLGLYNVKSVLVSSNIKQQSWRAILHVYSKGFWIFDPSHLQIVSTFPR